MERRGRFSEGARIAAPHRWAYRKTPVVAEEWLAPHREPAFDPVTARQELLRTHVEKYASVCLFFEGYSWFLLLPGFMAKRKTFDDFSDHSRKTPSFRTHSLSDEIDGWFVIQGESTSKSIA